eukprot:scaffold152027_cov28-Tisochrysis_lutea.AAC.3
MDTRLKISGWRALSQSSDEWTRPSSFSPTSIKAPKGVTFRTTPRKISPVLTSSSERNLDSRSKGPSSSSLASRHAAPSPSMTCRASATLIPASCATLDNLDASWRRASSSESSFPRAVAGTSPPAVLRITE